MRKIYWRHPVCLWRQWEVWKYGRSIEKWKGYKLRKSYEATKKVRRCYEKGTKMLRKRYEDVTKKIRRCYEKGTKLRKRYKVTKLRDSNAAYRDNLLWRIVMHYMKIKWREFPMVKGHGRRREHPNQTFCTNTKTKAREKTGHAHTSGQGRFWTGPFPVKWLSLPVKKAPQGRILRNFRLYILPDMRTS